MSDQEVVIGMDVPLSENQFFLSGYSFSGWINKITDSRY